MSRQSRRSLFRSIAGTGLGVGIGASGCAGPQGRRLASGGAVLEPPRKHATVVDLKFTPMAEVRVGLVGHGERGGSLLRDLLGIDGVRVTAVSDVVGERVSAAVAKIKNAGQNEPAVYNKSERDFEEICRRDDVDLVVTATPWDWHVPMALAAMNAGKHVAVEVPAAVSVDDCWRMVETSEATRRHCMMLENCCYGDEELLVLAMVRANLFGELVHAEAAYIHNLRKHVFEGSGEALWRRAEHTERDGNLYPTHGLGPVAAYMGINRGDRFDTLVSLSSMQRGFDMWREANVAKGDPRWKEKYVCGDMNTSIIRTGRGRTVMLQHDITSPRPYDRNNLVSGTKGAFRGYPARIYLEGQHEHEWIAPDGFKEKYTHPLWRRIGEIARKNGGHGGMDFIMLYRLIECMRQGLVPDMDVYDAAALSAAGALSVVSVRNGGAPARFPDFTRGEWQRERSPFGTEASV